MQDYLYINPYKLALMLAASSQKKAISSGIRIGRNVFRIFLESKMYWTSRKNVELTKSGALEKNIANFYRILVKYSFAISAHCFSVSFSCLSSAINANLPLLNFQIDRITFLWRSCFSLGKTTKAWNREYKPGGGDILSHIFQQLSVHWCCRSWLLCRIKKVLFAVTQHPLDYDFFVAGKNFVSSMFIQPCRNFASYLCTMLRFTVNLLITYVLWFRFQLTLGPLPEEVKTLLN